MTEARLQERERTFLRAQIQTPIGTTHECIVRNISSTGAHLVLRQPAPVPDEFNLSIPAKMEDHRVKVIWRDLWNVGVQFNDADEELTREQKIMLAENVRLRSLIRSLNKRLEDLGQDVSSET